VQYPGCGGASACPTGTCPAGEYVVGFDGNCGVICAVGVPGPPGPGTTVTCDSTKVVNLYVDPAGSDITGDGSFALPYKTIQHAIDNDVPSVIDGKYIINLKSPGTYVGTVILQDRLYFGDIGPDLSVCAAPTPPCSLVEILGSTEFTTDYILSPTAADSVSGGVAEITLIGSRLTLIGVTIQKSGYGIAVLSNSSLTLGAVYFLNNYTGLEIFNSNVYAADQNLYVNDCNDALCSNIAFNNGTIGGNPFTANFGIITGGQGVFTDVFCEGDSPAIDPGIYGIFLDGGGGFGRAISTAVSRIEIAGQIDMTLKAGKVGLHTEGNSETIEANIDIHGAGSGTGGIGLLLGSGSRANGIFNVDNIGTGVAATSSSQFTIPAMTSVGTSVITAIDGNIITADFVELGLSYTVYVDTPNYSLGPNVAFDPRLGTIHKITMTQNTTFSYLGINPAQADGTKLNLLICQDNVGGHTFTEWGGPVFKGLGVVGATANKCNSQSFVFFTSTGSWYATASMLTDM
jgi:hypothetical protein